LNKIRAALRPLSYFSLNRLDIDLIPGSVL
jgi:hypothetical protein